MCNALYILWAGDNTIVGSYQTLRLCKRNGVQNSLINVNSLSLSHTGLSTEGIYRVSGNKAEMESMQRQFDQGE